MAIEEKLDFLRRVSDRVDFLASPWRQAGQVGVNDRGQASQNDGWRKTVEAVFRARRDGHCSVAHFGDSITHAAEYASWGRFLLLRQPEFAGLASWTSPPGGLDGWRLCSDASAEPRTAWNGLQLQQFLVGEKSGISLDRLCARLNPRVVVFMLGTNDATFGRSSAGFAADFHQALEIMGRRGVLVVLSTIPPHPRAWSRCLEYNDAIRQAAFTRDLPLIDFFGAILRARAEDWNGSLMELNGVHPNGPGAGGFERELSAREMESLGRENGYFLRALLTLRMLNELRRLDTGCEAPNS